MDGIPYKKRPPENPEHNYVWPLICETCDQVVQIWFGEERCGCTPEHQHLDRMLERVRTGR